MLSNSDSIDIMRDSLFQSSKLINIDDTVCEKFIELLKTNENGYNEMIGCFTGDKKCTPLMIVKIINKNYDKTDTDSVGASDIIEYYNRHKKIITERIITERMFI